MSSSNKKAKNEETVISFLEAPKLSEVATLHFLNFKQLHEVYDTRIKKGNPLHGKNVPTSYKEPIDNHDLQIIRESEWIKASIIDEITKQQVQHSVEKRYNHNIEED